MKLGEWVSLRAKVYLQHHSDSADLIRVVTAQAGDKTDHLGTEE